MHMKNVSRLLVLGVGILLTGCNSTAPKTVRWEYRAIDVSNDARHKDGVNSEINRMASEGWEVVSFNPDPAGTPNEWRVLFRRPKQ
jgi:hypothetical protein